MLAAIRAASWLRYQSSGFFRYWAGPRAARTAGAATTARRIPISHLDARDLISTRPSIPDRREPRTAIGVLGALLGRQPAQTAQALRLVIVRRLIPLRVTV